MYCVDTYASFCYHIACHGGVYSAREQKQTSSVSSNGHSTRALELTCADVRAEFSYLDLYYNVGVMVFNLDQMRRDGYVPEMVKYLNAIRLWCTEQDVLNLYGVDMHKDKEIPTRYNETQFTGQSDDPAVVHYAGFPDWWKCGENLPRREYLQAYRERFTPPRE